MNINEIIINDHELMLDVLRGEIGTLTKDLYKRLEKRSEHFSINAIDAFSPEDLHEMLVYSNDLIEFNLKEKQKCQY